MDTVELESVVLVSVEYELSVDTVGSGAVMRSIKCLIFSRRFQGEKSLSLFIYNNCKTKS